jgi:hypothetical protein
MAVQRDGEINDSLRVDISKTNLRPMARRKERVKYMVVEGGMDGCRADAKSGQPGPGEKWQGAIGAREETRANNPPRNRG